MADRAADDLGAADEEGSGLTLTAADRSELRQVVRNELQLLFRESLPASLQTKVSEAVELRAVERFNLTSRTKLTLDDVSPTPLSFLQADANGFATFATAAGGSGATVTRGTLAGRPTAAVLGAGNVYYTTDTFQLVRSNGATYDEIGLEDIFQATGDLVAGASADTPVRFPVGTNGQCIIADSTAAGIGLRYVGLGSVTGSVVKAQTPLTTKGDLWVTDGTNMHRLAVSVTDGQVVAASAAAADGLAYIALGAINGSLATAQTPLTTKGDLFGFGPALARVPVSGTNNQVLAAVSANATGVGYIDLGTINGSIVRVQTPLTTKGDILSTDGTTLHRVGVGTKAQALVADSAQTDGVKFGYPVAHYMQQQALNGATADGLPRCNMVREAIQNDVASTFATGVMSVVGIWLEAGLIITRIGCINGATAGATLTHRWAAIYTPGGAALGRQSTDVVTATTTANTWLEFTLSATYTVPADGYYIIGVMFAGTTMPTARGGGLGNAIVGNPTGATGVTFPFVAGSASTALTTTAPAGPLTITAQGRQFAVWLY